MDEKTNERKQEWNEKEGTPKLEWTNFKRHEDPTKRDPHLPQETRPKKETRTKKPSKKTTLSPKNWTKDPEKFC